MNTSASRSAKPGEWLSGQTSRPPQPAAGAGGPLLGGPTGASGRSLPVRRRRRLGQPFGCDPKGLLGAVVSVSGLGRRCRRPLAPGCTGRRRRIPHGPGGEGARVLTRCGRWGPFCPLGYVRRSEDWLCEPHFQRSRVPFRCGSLCQGPPGCRDCSHVATRIQVDAEHPARMSDPTGLLL